MADDTDTNTAGFQLQTGTGDNDRLIGTHGMDRLLGQDGQDLLFGNLGRDYLEGGGGSDDLYGNRGGDDRVEDRFVFDRDDGSDIIFDFVPPGSNMIKINPMPEGDKIVLLGGTQEDIDGLIEAAATRRAEAVKDYEAHLSTSDGKDLRSPDASLIYGDGADPWAEFSYGETHVVLRGVEGDTLSADWFVLG